METEETFRLGLKLKPYNAKLKALRESLGLTTKQMAAKWGLGYVYYIGIENMRFKPGARAFLKFEKSFKLLPEEYFPEQLRSYKPGARYIEKDIPVLALDSPEVLELTDDTLTQVEQRVDIEESLKTLTERERKVMELRYGLRDGQPRTLKEVGEVFGISGCRIGQYESSAKSKMRKFEYA